jgi:AraC-like DNA-binding protein
MTYREHRAPLALAPWLACTWERRDGGGAPVRVVPDGCIDIVWTQGRGARVVGPNTTAFLVALDAGVSVVGARMRPGAAPALLGVDAPALRDGSVALADVWGDDAGRLEDRLERCEDQHIEVMMAALHLCVRRAAAPDPLVRAAVERLRAPAARVDALARELDVSARQLHRRFEAAVGYGPKRLARVLRLERALALARGGEELAQAAAGAGYADQAHLTHDCRALAGVPPSALRAA